MDTMHPWFGNLTPEQVEQFAAQYGAPAPSTSHAKSGVGAKGEIDAETMRELHEINARLRAPTEDPVLAVPEFVPTNEALEALHHRALFFLDGLNLNAWIEDVDVHSIYLVFLGHRIYIVPQIPGKGGPDYMFEPWFKGDEEWEKRGMFSNAYRAFEHVYFRVMRARIGELVRTAK